MQYETQPTPTASLPPNGTFKGVPYRFARLGVELVIGLVLIIGGGFLLINPHSDNLETGFFAVLSGIVGYYFGQRTEAR